MNKRRGRLLGIVVITVIIGLFVYSRWEDKQRINTLISCFPRLIASEDRARDVRSTIMSASHRSNSPIEPVGAVVKNVSGCGSLPHAVRQAPGRQS